MPSLAITGLIGSGKSEVLLGLTQALDGTSFSADAENSRLLDGDASVREEIVRCLGGSCYDEAGRADRKFLRELIGRDQSARTTLEGILHPRIEEVWKPLALSCHKPEKVWFLAEIPLLYEKDLAHYFDAVIVVACDDAIRHHRLVTRRSLTSSQATHWLALQQSQESKISRADHLIWNDGPPLSLTAQISRLAATLQGS